MASSFRHLPMLRLLFAALFVLLSASQPGLYAMANAAGGHVGGGNELVESVLETNDTRDDLAESETKRAAAERPAGKICVVHCAPSQAVPADCPQIASANMRCFAPLPADVLEFSDYSEVAQPPRSLG